MKKSSSYKTKEKILSTNYIPEYKRISQTKNTKNHSKARRKWKSKYRNTRGRNRFRGIVPCLQGRTYTP